MNNRMKQISLNLMETRIQPEIVQRRSTQVEEQIAFKTKRAELHRRMCKLQRRTKKPSKSLKNIYDKILKEETGMKYNRTLSKIHRYGLFILDAILERVKQEAIIQGKCYTEDELIALSAHIHNRSVNAGAHHLERNQKSGHGRIGQLQSHVLHSKKFCRDKWTRAIKILLSREIEIRVQRVKKSKKKK